MKRFLSLAYWSLAYGIFCHAGLRDLVHRPTLWFPEIDTGGPHSAALAGGCHRQQCYWECFAAQHIPHPQPPPPPIPPPIMARQGFTRVWTQVVPKHPERPLRARLEACADFVALANGAHPTTVWELHGPVAILLAGTYWLGMDSSFSSTFLINHFDYLECSMFGVISAARNTAAHLRTRCFP